MENTRHRTLKELNNKQVQYAVDAPKKSKSAMLYSSKHGSVLEPQLACYSTQLVIMVETVLCICAIQEQNRNKLLEAPSAAVFWKEIKRPADPAPVPVFVRTRRSTCDVFEKKTQPI